MEALKPDRVIGGHGPVAGPEAIATTRGYIETVLELAAQPGEHEIPSAFAEWEFGDGFAQNLEALRAR
jgi:hypothetical protein